LRARDSNSGLLKRKPKDPTSGEEKPLKAMVGDREAGEAAGQASGPRLTVTGTTL
jgi:hypothetical protein